MTSTIMTSEICSPFAHLNIDDYRKLDDTEGRTLCPKCSRSRKYFCYTCYCPVARLKTITPYVKLPIQIDILKHRLECDGKSTACHAAVIAPDHVVIHTYPDFPHFDAEKTILLFPGRESVSLEHMVSWCQAAGPEQAKGDNSSSIIQESDLKKADKSDCDRRELCNGYHIPSSDSCKTGTAPESDQTQQHITNSEQRYNSDDKGNEQIGSCLASIPVPSFDRVVFIDATWNQVHGMLRDDRIKAFKKVELSPRLSHFWRHQKGSPATFLSTIEAIYYFVRDYHDLYVRTPYHGQYDNLLFFFSCLYEKVNCAKEMRKRNS